MILKDFLFTLIAIIVFANVKAQLSKSEIMATGLTRFMFSNAINKQLKSLNEVDSVVTNLNTNTFVVDLKKEAIISPRVLKEKVTFLWVR